MTVIAPYQSQVADTRDGFGQLLRAEWTKFRTVRGWMITLLVTVLVMVGFGLLSAAGTTSSCAQDTSSGPGPARSGAGCLPTFPLGPGGEPVSDSFYLVHQPLTGNGSITTRITSLTGLVQPPNGSQGPGPGDTQPGVMPWSKAGVIIKQNLNQGSAYAAMMVTGGHGVRMQWNYTGDTAGLPGTVSANSPRWLRLTRSGDVITGYDSANGTNWTQVGTVTLSGLPSTVQVGLFGASPDYTSVVQNFGGGTSSKGGGPTQVTGVFDRVTLSGGSAAGPWASGYVGADNGSGIGGYHQAGGQFTVTGSGDIAPIAEGHGGPADAALTIHDYLLGTFAGLIALAVIAAMFMTAEYRRNLIRVTLAASPRRGRVLAAKAIVVAAVSFVAGLVGAALAVAVGTAVTHSRGYWEFPVSGPVEARVIVGTGLLAAVTAVLALAIGTIVRRSAATVAIVIVTIVLPYFLAVASVVPLGVADWLLRVTPAAGFAVQGAYPEYGQVTAIYSALSGYYPLGALAGLGLLCAWTAVALAWAAVLLRRRDA
ncbi:MAG TPA: ABC transporter permease subunit [Trebonia sp.]|nr:ABC transporter permease subunit [Trebonia sp.]